MNLMVVVNDKRKKKILQFEVKHMEAQMRVSLELVFVFSSRLKLKGNVNPERNEISER